MAATGLQLNFDPVSFAPGGTPVTLTEVTSVMFGQGGGLIQFSGDNDRYPVVIANNVNNPHCSITSGNIAQLFFAPGATGTILATQMDALGATGGAINWSMVNSVFQNCDNTGQWGQFGSATATWLAFSSDGITPPLSIASRS